MIRAQGFKPFFMVKSTEHKFIMLINVKATYSVTFDLLILELIFLFFKNTVKKLKFRYTFYQFRKS